MEALDLLLTLHKVLGENGGSGYASLGFLAYLHRQLKVCQKQHNEDALKITRLGTAVASLAGRRTIDGLLETPMSAGGPGPRRRKSGGRKKK